MRMVTDHDFTRVEFDWLAHDEVGQIGFISTAGAGPVPSASLADASRLEELFEQLQMLPETGEAQVAARVDYYIADLLGLASRGFYVFDWWRETRSYRMIASPSNPLSLTRLKPPLRELAERVRLRITFERGTEFDATVDVRGPQ